VISSAAVSTLKAKYKELNGRLDEATLRLWAAVEARSLGRGGISIVARAIGLSRTTIHVGLNELENANATKRASEVSQDRIRTVGAGRKRLVDKNPKLKQALEALLEPATRGDPQSPLRWTCKSTTKLAAALNRRSHQVSQRTVCRLLAEMDYSLQSNRKAREGTDHPDRDAQFIYISRLVKRFQREGQPVISVDTKKKELIGDFANGGREWQPKGKPETVRVHDFVDPDLGKVAPYGVYDITANEGWVSVGINHDTAQFSVQSIRCWWREMGSQLYPKAQRLLITADCGGSNGNRVRLWKVELQKLADELKMDLRVCHFPPGTSKWNKIEHRMFCHITKNWRGRPLLSRRVVVNLIGRTTTAEGLRIKAKLDTKQYPLKIKVSNEIFAAIAIRPDKFHGEWNYTIKNQS
jgi:Rhodopirellula transposase DDE domain